MKVKGFLKDVGGASRVTKRRKQMFDEASAKPNPIWRSNPLRPRPRPSSSPRPISLISKPGNS